MSTHTEFYYEAPASRTPLCGLTHRQKEDEKMVNGLERFFEVLGALAS